MAKLKEETAPMDIQCVDIWPPGTLRRAEMMAYKESESAGMIRIQKIQISQKSGRATVRYDSTIPHEWVLQQLRERKVGIAARGEQMSMEVKA